MLPTSGAVGRILKSWNIGADSVVFVDDTPLELEEVRAAHPGIECIQFPKSDYAAGLAFLRRLRDLFGKATVSEEDAFRLESIRQGQQFHATNGTGASAEDFLSTAEATVTLEYNPPPTDTRVIELVNKTNQFNLNGIRYTEAEWQKALRRPHSFCLAVSYKDKFCPLGKIAVLRGVQEGKRLCLDAWVMSCRAFSRRIEHQTIEQLFQKFSADEIVFEFRETSKNSPTRDFLTSVLDQPPAPDCKLTRERFEAKCPKLYHKVIENQ